MGVFSKNVTRGGQIGFSNMRMWFEVVRRILLCSLPILIFVFGVLLYKRVTPYDWLMVKTWLQAGLIDFFLDGSKAMNFPLPNGNPYSTTVDQIVNAPFILQQVFPEIIHAIKISFEIAFVSYVSFSAIIFYLFKRKGSKERNGGELKGDRLGTVSQVRKRIRKERGKWFYFGFDRFAKNGIRFGVQKLPIPAYSEMQHFLFHGTTGSGKSVTIKSLLDQIRARGDRAIIYDKSGSYLKDFYRAGSDILLNPFDERSAAWAFWRECRNKSDFESMAAALIPMSPQGQDPFWNNAARTIFAAAAFAMYERENYSLEALLDALFSNDLRALQPLLKGTEAESLVSEKAEKTAISIKTVLSTSLRSLRHLKEDEGFSIRQWVQDNDMDDESNNWIFVSSLQDQHESLKPLITAWLDISINALMSLPEDRNRRIWVILDELPSLQQLPYLNDALSQARKFGGCFIVGLQSYSQLAKVYGENGAREISSVLGTRFFFRSPDQMTAEWASKNLGQSTSEEVQENLSYGVDSVRDGVSLNRVERTKPVVSASQIMNLRDLQCYVRLSGEYPIVKLKMKYEDRPTLAKAFVARPDTKKVVVASGSSSAPIIAPAASSVKPEEAVVAAAESPVPQDVDPKSGSEAADKAVEGKREQPVDLERTVQPEFIN